MALPRVGPAVLRRSARLPFERRVRGRDGDDLREPAGATAEIVEAYEAELRRRETDPWVADAVLAGAAEHRHGAAGLPRRSLWADVAKVRCPVLLVYGGRDRLVDARVRNRAQAAFRDARLLYLPRSGHVAQIEHPQEVARAFRQLVRSSR